jgi:hypothetical protein
MLSSIHGYMHWNWTRLVIADLRIKTRPIMDLREARVTQGRVCMLVQDHATDLFSDDGRSPLILGWVFRLTYRAARHLLSLEGTRRVWSGSQAMIRWARYARESRKSPLVIPVKTGI